MGKRVCRHCPIPGRHSNFSVRLANHLTKVHELSEIERKYWLQFAKLQNTNAIRVYDKEAEPKTIFLQMRVHKIELVSCDHGSEMKASLPRSYRWPHVLWEKSICKTFTRSRRRHD